MTPTDNEHLRQLLELSMHNELEQVQVIDASEQIGHALLTHAGIDEQSRNFKFLK